MKFDGQVEVAAVDRRAYETARDVVAMVAVVSRKMEVDSAYIERKCHVRL